jgi:hypothetical protein
MKLRVVVADSLGAEGAVSYGSAAGNDPHFRVPGHLQAPMRSLLSWTRRRWRAGSVAGPLGDCSRVGRH